MPNAPLEDGILANKEAEEAVIGSLLLDVSYLPSLNLTPDSFSSPCSRLWFVAISDVARRGEGVDQITVSHELDRVGKLTEAGGVAYAAHVTAKLPTTLNCPHYAAIVRDLAARRTIIAALNNMMVRCHAADKVDTALAEADATITALRKQHSRSPLLSPRDWVELLDERYATLNNTPDHISLSTGIPELNLQLGGGLYPGTLTTIGAATGMGKTEFGLHLANKASEKGHVLLCSAEMNAGDIGDRSVSRITKMDIARVRSGAYDVQEYATIKNALGVLDERRVWLLPQGSLTLRQIRAEADKVATSTGDLRLVVVDYLQELVYEGKEEMRYRQLGTMMRELKALAMEQNIPIVVLSQITRDMTMRKDKRPALSDLKESGDIENVSDNVLLLWCLDYYYPASVYEYEYQNHPEWIGQYRRETYPSGITEVAIAKLRQSSGRRVSRKPVQMHYDPNNGYVGIVKL